MVARFIAEPASFIAPERVMPISFELPIPFHVGADHQETCTLTRFKQQEMDQ
jgi:hypothetical protein